VQRFESSQSSKFICELQTTDLEFYHCGHHQTFLLFQEQVNVKYQNTAGALGEIPALGVRFYILKKYVLENCPDFFMTAERENKEQMNEFKNISWDKSVGIVSDLLWARCPDLFHFNPLAPKFGI
jgi:hypothetical protein